MIKKLAHIILVLTILLSSMGFVIQKHFCQNKLKSVSVFVEAKSCHEDMTEKSSCPMHRTEEHNHNSNQEKKGCCDDTAEFVKLDQKFQTESFQIQLQSNPILLGIIVLALRLSALEEDTPPTHFLNYKPPLLVCDFTVSLQTFLC